MEKLKNLWKFLNKKTDKYIARNIYDYVSSKILSKKKMEKTYTKEEVKDILYDVYDVYDIQNNHKFNDRFEGRLNDKGLTGNNGANENKLWDFHEADIESFII